MSKPIQPNIPEGSERYFTNCRGVNIVIPLRSVWKECGYLPRVHPDNWAAPGVVQTVSYDASSTFIGTNKTAQWWYYNEEDADWALKTLRSAGLNTVRIFLDFYVWLVKGQDFLDDLANFMSLCDKYKIRCQPTLWDQLNILQEGVPDGTSSEPKSRSDAIASGISYNLGLIGAAAQWPNTPYLFETSSHAQAQDFYDTYVEDYVDAIVSATSSYQSLWCIDVQNESDSQEHLRVITSSTSTYIRNTYPFVKTTFGNGAGFDPGQYYLYRDSGGASGSFPPLYQFSSTVDFATMHNYGNTNYFLKRYVREGVSGSSDTGLALMYNEASNYPTVNYPREVIKYVHRDKDIGGMIYQGFVERTGTQNPFNNAQGVFYDDGTCRAALDVSAYITLAEDQGWFSRRQLTKPSNVVEKGPSEDGGLDGGFTPGTISGVIPGFPEALVLPEHVAYQDSYTGMTKEDWELTRNAFYGYVPFFGTLTYVPVAAAAVNPYINNLSAVKYAGDAGGPYSPRLNVLETSPRYNFATSSLTIKDLYDEFYTLSSLPSLNSFSNSDSSEITARNNQVLKMSYTIFMVIRTLFAASGVHSTPGVMREELYGTIYDDLSGIHEVVSVEDRLAFSSAYSGLGSPSTENTIMPAYDCIPEAIPTITSNDASGFTCHQDNNCFYQGGSPPVGSVRVADIDWAAYDTFYSNLIEKAAVCIDALQNYGETVDPDFKVY